MSTPLSLIFSVQVFISLFLVFSFLHIQPTSADWESWWTYEGISGPDFWGRLNPKWSHCSKGARQSPIDIDTNSLLYDPTLSPLKLSGGSTDSSGGHLHVRGALMNTGRGIAMGFGQEKPVIFSEGPLSYQYTLANLSLHFGRENSRGSEHTINGRAFDGELQLLAFNSQLYTNFTEAMHEPNGIVAISVFIVLSQTTSGASAASTSSGSSTNNSAMKKLTGALKNITRRGQSVWLDALPVVELLPTLGQYVTYEGSLTQPACHETVQWILLNRPLHITAYQFHMLRHSLKGDGHQDNFRPVQSLNRRAVRTNIVAQNIVEHQQQQQQHLSRHNNHQQQNQHQHVQQSVKQPQSSRSVEVNGDDELTSIEHLVPSTVHDISSTIDDACDPRQLRLYGYRANRKMFEEL